MPDDVQPEDAVVQLITANFPGLRVPAAVAARLPALVPRRRLADGRSLFVQGQRPTAFYAVAAGAIESRFTGADGRISVLGEVAPPRFFGLAAFAARLPAEYEAVARGASEVFVIGREAYTLLMDGVPGFARALMAEFAQRYDGTLRQLQAARHLAAPERFRLALAQLAGERGVPAGDGWVRVQATQSELAQLAHVSRQTANELLAAAEADGQVRRGRGQWWWRDGGCGLMGFESRPRGSCVTRRLEAA
ncbi:Crp/Fnr family transcriptional regulator [Pelomonas sp. UHG3]|uniref:Crp/Fnr family transcriptional regulator n=1 Tax=Roseateles hydrophilus TaxID=2975054 RepID=A0ACC6C9U3_9BURK|nr:Crp/Fnr family transcriptional regulator [Pelomonas sp. UHG3]MCY4745155.1 Crp/Fnr family transcriptional regulator [Pelomonas sp. UHG3]